MSDNKEDVIKPNDEEILKNSEEERIRKQLTRIERCKQIRLANIEFNHSFNYEICNSDLDFDSIRAMYNPPYDGIIQDTTVKFRPEGRNKIIIQGKNSLNKYPDVVEINGHRYVDAIQDIRFVDKDSAISSVTVYVSDHIIEKITPTSRKFDIKNFKQHPLFVFLTPYIEHIFRIVINFHPEKISSTNEIKIKYKQIKFCPRTHDKLFKIKSVILPIEDEFGPNYIIYTHGVAHPLYST